MIPENRLSSEPQSSAFAGARSLSATKLLNYETGGIGISDSSQGLMVQTWRGRYIGNNIILDVPSNPSVSSFIAYSGAAITEFSFSFDQLMRPVVVLIQYGNCIVKWYDSSINDYVVIDFGDVITNPRVSLDDKRPAHTTDSDIIFAYLRDNNLYYRQQRDRFQIEILLRIGVYELFKIGFGINNRFLFEVSLS